VLRAGSLPGNDLVVRRLTTLEEVTCVSPAYVARHGPPEQLDALQDHYMVAFHSSATGAVYPRARHLSPRLRAFVGWLTTTFTANLPLS
jgi:DNA-binding transcriptional LysR family regulator